MPGLAKPRLRDVSSTLEGFAITTFDVPLERLSAQLPASLRPEAVTLDDGRTRGLVSAVTFVNLDFHVGFAPFVRLLAPQTNFRAYVRHGDEPRVWFFGTTLGSRFVALPRLLWRLPWARGRHEHAFEFDAGHCTSYHWRAESEHGLEELDALGLAQAVGRLDGFADPECTWRILTHPLVGYLRRRDGRYATYGVDHERLDLERARATRARFELFERLGLVEPGQPPHSLLLMPRTHFIVRLPPRRVSL